MTRTPFSLVVAACTALAGVALADTPAKKTAKAGAPMRTVVLVHGAFADGSSWDKVITQLQAKGYNVVAVHAPLSSLADDVDATKRVLDMQSGDVTLVGHSYGGVVISEAGNHPKVKSLVYIAAFVPDANESIADLGKGKPQPAWVPTVQVDGGGYGALPLASVKQFFAQDVSAADAKLITAKQGPIRMKNLEDKVTTAAWKTKPSWYLRAEQDRMIDPGAQATMAKRANATTKSIKTSHVPMLSKPAAVTNMIVAASAAPEVAAR